MDLRIAGLTYQQIADRLGIKAPSAYELVSKALKDINAKVAESAEELRRLELERLDKLLRALVPEDGPIEPENTDRALRVMKRRAEMLALDAPPARAGDDPPPQEVFLRLKIDE